VGLASAAIVVRLTGAPRSLELWVGAFIASGLPDMDLVLEWLGLRGPRYHRNASHSLVLVGVLALVGWVAVRQLGIPLDERVLLAWVVALAAHPVLDVFTTGPALGARGYGIGIFWPLHGKRWYSRRPLIDQITDWGSCRSVQEVWDGLWPELALLGPVCVLVIVLTIVL
jgi:membrane-bound metal-dependent hydrolase YbcI (DUF457 family)